MSYWGVLKPPAGTRIDWSHPLARGLVSACVPGNMGANLDTASGTLASANVSMPCTTGCWFGGDGTRETPVSPRIEAVSGASIPSITVATSARNGDINQQNLLFHGYWAGGDNICMWRLYQAYTVTHPRIDWWNDRTTVNGIDTYGTLSYQKLAFTFDAEAKTIQLFQGGVATGSAGTTSLTWPRTGGKWVRMGAFGGSGYQPVTEHSYTWARALSQQEIAWVSAEPYSMFQPPEVFPFYSIPASIVFRRSLGLRAGSRGAIC